MHMHIRISHTHTYTDMKETKGDGTVHPERKRYYAGGSNTEKRVGERGLIGPRNVEDRA